MKWISFDGGRVGYIEGEEVVDVTPQFSSTSETWPPVNMLRVAAAGGKGRCADVTRLPLSSVRLECPIQWPNKVIAFPANYRDHIVEMKQGLVSKFSADGQGFFLKAGASLSGPADPIVIPAIPGREVHHESELAVIIGAGGRYISREKAFEAIFGYSCLIDVVVRGKEERVMRKSFDGFCPVGPHIVTADEVADVQNLTISLKVNGQMRQHANTRDLIVDIPGMIEMASSVMTLFPGDIIASGTPAGVGPLSDGDLVEMSIDEVGSLCLRVRADNHAPHAVWKK